VNYCRAQLRHELREKAVLPHVASAFDNYPRDWNPTVNESSYKGMVICLFGWEHRGDMSMLLSLFRGKHCDHAFRAAFSRRSEDMKNSWPAD
jgi:hypothetical protein